MTGAPRRARAIAAISAVAGLLILLPSPSSAATAQARTPVQHLVFMLQSNHSFDNYFGTRPGVDRTPAGTCQPVAVTTARPCIRPFHITENVDTSPLRDSSAVFAAQYGKGKMNGFVAAYSASRVVPTSMGYYTKDDVAYYHELADRYVLFDRYFASAPSGGVANRMYAVAAQPGKASPRGAVPATGWGDVRTIFDALQARGISWKFYVQNYDAKINFRTTRKAHADRAAQVVRVPLLGFARFIHDPQLAAHIVDMDQYYVDLGNGTLPAVSYIATSGDNEHPPASIVAGERTVQSLISALQRSTSWRTSAFMLAWDDWGGWYDHVRPPVVQGQQYGFRVPGLLVSPYARRAYVDSATVDHTSVLKFVEDNWGLPPLTARDRSAESIAGGFDFKQVPRAAELSGAGRTNLAAGIHRDRVYLVYGLAVFGVLALITVVAVRERRREITPDATVAASPKVQEPV